MGVCVCVCGGGHTGVPGDLPIAAPSIDPQLHPRPPTPSDPISSQKAVTILYR